MKVNKDRDGFDENCGNCKFARSHWEQEPDLTEDEVKQLDKYGELLCKRYPPHIDDYYPQVFKDDWCGEWRSWGSPLSRV